MNFLTENIVIVWLIPIVFQIILPLLMLVLYGVTQMFSVLFVASKMQVQKEQQVNAEQTEIQSSTV